MSYMSDLRDMTDKGYIRHMSDMSKLIDTSRMIEHE